MQIPDDKQHLLRLDNISVFNACAHHELVQNEQGSKRHGCCSSIGEKGQIATCCIEYSDRMCRKIIKANREKSKKKCMPSEALEIICA